MCLIALNTFSNEQAKDKTQAETNLFHSVNIYMRFSEVES